MKVSTLKFYSVEEVRVISGLSRSSAYRLIQLLNNELKGQGKVVIPGKISKSFFDDKLAIHKVAS